MTMQNDIIVCPDCGQSYDPAIESAEFQSSRGTKMKTRVGAQDRPIARRAQRANADAAGAAVSAEIAPEGARCLTREEAAKELQISLWLLDAERDSARR